MTNRTVLITGCSSGFGKLAVNTFRAGGWNVVATMRSPEKEAELTGLEGVLVTRLDVKDSQSIDAAFEQGAAAFGSIDAVVNNAGYGSNALFEQSPDASVRDIYETNVFGLMNVMRRALPDMRERGSGRIVNVTSMAGLMGLLGNSVYSSSKFAVEGLTEALALEYKPLGVRIVSVAPGAYLTTAFGANTDNYIESGDPQLVEHSQNVRDHFASIVSGGTPQDPQEVADKIYECVTADEVPVHNPVGADAERLSGLIDSLPSRQAFVDAMEQMLLPPAG
ncbi:MAG: SDR family oxidoreductase [Acidobacteria bacterium]|nr:SDR family oxidoreductase [Acidobacteriota bacterium]